MKALMPNEPRKGRRRSFCLAGSLALSLCLFGSAATAQQISLPSRLPDPYTLPDPQRVFRLESEGQLRERMTRESQLGINPLNLKYDYLPPDYPAVPEAGFLTRNWAPLTEVVPPAYVCYRRLYFEQINLERYGWPLGVISPFASQAAFYFDLVTLPYHAGTEILRRYECNAGYCLPGDPVPLLLYPPEWSWTGALAEGAVIGIGFVMFP